MTRAAFYGRVSGDEQQDPESSVRWQRRIAAEIAERQGLQIVREYFDEDSRQIAWKLRPNAQRLLEDMASPRRDFDALIVAEQARAFYGTQAAHVLPLFRHHGIAYYSPEFANGYRHDDPGDQISISVQGTLAEAEIRRTRTRVTTAMQAQTESEGRFLGGRPPYGYNLIDAGPHPTRAKARAGQRVHRLEINATTAPIVRRIFDEFMAGSGYGRIASGLTQDGVASPSAADPERNKHRLSSKGAWAKSAVRAILTNPRYTGHQVWQKTSGSERLRDVRDVSLGTRKHMSHLAPNEWIWSAQPVHEPIISVAEHQLIMQRLGREPAKHGARRTNRPYRARGIVRCAICRRKMNAHWLRGHPYYRCVYATAYALPAGTNHPKTAYIRESSFVPQLGDWLASIFDPANLDATCELLASAQDYAPDESSRNIDDAKHRRAEAIKKIQQCEDLLGEGADLRTVSGWLNAAVADREAADRILATAPSTSRLTADDFRRLVGEVPDLADLFANGNAEDVQQVLSGLGVEVLYHPIEGTLVASAALGWCADDGVEGGT